LVGTDLSSLISNVSTGQESTQVPHPLQLSGFTFTSTIYHQPLSFEGESKDNPQIKVFGKNRRSNSFVVSLQLGMFL
jgi:hypothetical protein